MVPILGSITQINLLRPNWWLDQIKVDSVGSIVYLNMPEMGIDGMAKVIGIRQCHLDTRNKGVKHTSKFQPVTGMFVHQVQKVYELSFEGSQELLEVTGSHPIWSNDRNDWVIVSDLIVGEHIKTQNGQVVLVDKKELYGPRKVFNIEVYRGHNCFVSKAGVLVHNSCWGGEFFYKGKGMQKAIDHIWEGHSFARRQTGKSYFLSGYNTKGKIKNLVSDARAKAKANQNAGLLRPDGKRIFQVEMDEYIGVDQKGRKTKIMTIIEDGGRYNNAFPGSL